MTVKRPAPPDIDAIKKISMKVEEVMTKITQNIPIKDGITIINKEKLLASLQLLQSCLASFEKCEIPEKYPDFRDLENMIKDPSTYVKEEIVKTFERISGARSCVHIDKAMISKLALKLKDVHCLEVYAGNGWLSSELAKQGISIYATDNFQSDTNRISPFLRKVEDKDAYEEAVNFSCQHADGKTKAILLGFPAGSLNTLIKVILLPLFTKNVKIILIAAPKMYDLINENARFLLIQNNEQTDCLLSRDITNQTDYTPAIVGERVYEFRAPERS